MRTTHTCLCFQSAELCGAGTLGLSLWKCGGCSAPWGRGEPPRVCAPRPSAPVWSVPDMHSKVCWEPQGTVLLHPRGKGLLPGSDDGWRTHLLMSTTGSPALTRGHPPNPPGRDLQQSRTPGAQQHGGGGDVLLWSVTRSWPRPRAGLAAPAVTYLREVVLRELLLLQHGRALQCV